MTDDREEMVDSGCDLIPRITSSNEHKPNILIAIHPGWLAVDHASFSGSKRKKAIALTCLRRYLERIPLCTGINLVAIDF